MGRPGETTGGETAGGETTGDSAGTGGTTFGGSDSGNCGTCSAPPNSVYLTAPDDGATVGSPFTVAATATYSCSCDTCGCYEDQPQSITIFADGNNVASCQSCSGRQTFDLELPPGEHELYASANYSFHSERSETIRVNVTGSGATTDTEGATAGSLDDDNEGCGCTTTNRRGTMGWALLGLFGLASRRRRRDALGAAC